MKGVTIMRNKNLITRVLSIMLCVLLIAGAMPFGAVLAADEFGGSDSMTVAYDNAGTFTVKFSADTLAEIIKTRSLTKDDFKAMLPTSVISAYQNDGLAGVVSSDPVTAVFDVDDLVDLLPESAFSEIDLEEEIPPRLEIYRKVFTNIYNTAADITLNGTSIFAEDGDHFSLAAIQKVLSDAVPTLDELKNIPADGIVETLTSVITFNADTAVTVALKIGFYGTEAHINDLETAADKVSNFLAYVLEGTLAGLLDTDIEATVPVKVTDYIDKALRSNEISDETKIKIIRFFAGTGSEAIATLKDLSAGEFASFVKKLDNSITNGIAGLIEDHEVASEKLYDKLIALLENAPEEVVSKTLDDYYLGDGNFELAYAETITKEQFFDRAAIVYSRFDSLRVLFADEDLTYDNDIKVGFEDLRQINFINNGTTVFTTYLPKDIEIALITNLIDEINGFDWVFDINDPTTVAEYMPAEDTNVYVYYDFQEVVSRDQLTVNSVDVASIGGNPEPTTINICNIMGETLRIWGWYGCNREIEKLGYRINGGEIVYDDSFFYAPEGPVVDAVNSLITAGEPRATRFQIMAPIAEDTTIIEAIVYTNGEERVIWTINCEINHNLEHHDLVPSTCATAGTAEYWECTLCGKKFSDAEATTEIDNIDLPLDPDNHEGPFEHHDAVPSTCVTAGTAEYWECTACGKKFADEAATTEIEDLALELDPTNHEGPFEVRNAKEAKPGEKGYTGDTYCVACDGLVEEGQEIAELPQTGDNSLVFFCAAAVAVIGLAVILRKKIAVKG